MGKEIERKFLVKDKSYHQLAKGILYQQGYICSMAGRTVRVRICDEKGFLTVKSKSIGATRLEYEYEIPLADAEEMLAFLCEKPIIEKYRYKYEYKGFLWEIDEFKGENEGLVIAEIELSHEDEAFEKPDWIGSEVTGISRYFNSNLMRSPYSSWKIENK
ncbi:MAG: CYTH domain-containing protein [Clostridia bacterium]|nr:CYTH domain-containing protein [Clostridia bacterium]